MNIEELSIIDQSFSESAFKAKVDNTFVMLLNSVMLWDMDRVKHKISDDLYNYYVNIVNNLKNSNSRQMYDELNVKSTEILNIEKNDDSFLINVLLVSRYMDYIIDTNTGNLKTGNNSHRIEKNNYLTFAKRINAKYEGSARHCPGCGANIDSNNTGICSYCGTSYNTVDYDWVLISMK